MTQTSLAFEIADPGVDRIVDMVRALMSDGRWWATFELQEEIWRTRGVRASESGISARVRDLRKAAYGAHIVAIRRRSGTKSYEYRLEQKHVQEQ